MKRRYLSLLALAGLCLAGPLPGLAAAAAPQPRVSANYLVDSVIGNRFVPHGVNWPSFEYACEQGWGYSSPGADADTAAAMAARKINAVRLPLNQDCWLGDDGLPYTKRGAAQLTVAGYRSAVTKFVEELNQQDIVVVLDLHWSGPDGAVADGLRNMADDRSDDFWSSAASAFRNDPSIIFDLFNEPHSRGWNPTRGNYDFNLTWNKWQSGGLLALVEREPAFTTTRFSGATKSPAGKARFPRLLRWFR